MKTARIEVSEESNGTWFVAFDTTTNHEVAATRYGLEYLTNSLRDMGYTVEAK